MAHFAKLDKNNLVMQVIVVSNSDITDASGAESEACGQAFCRMLFGPGSTWLQTSYNGNIRKNFAGTGYTYDASHDAFIPPKPHASWVLDESTCRWQAPVSMPATGGPWLWNEQTQCWE